MSAPITIYAKGFTVEVFDNATPPPPPPPSGETITVDAAQRFQVMEGWEVNASAWATNKTTNAYDPGWLPLASQMAAKIVGELGIQRVQIAVRSGWQNSIDYWPQFVAGSIDYLTLGAHWYQPEVGAPYQFSEFDFTVNNIAKQCRAVNPAVVVSLVFVDFGGHPGTIDFSQNPAAYGAMLKAYADRLRDVHGITPVAINMICEPENSSGWNNAARIGSCAVALRAVLSAYPNIKLIAPDCTNAYNTVPYAQAIDTVSGAMAALNVIGYHRYGGGSGDVPAILSYAQSKGKLTGMTEWFNATIDTIIDDLTLGNVTVWQKWGYVGKAGVGSNPQSTYYIYDPATGQINFATNTPHMALVFPYVKLGAQRIGCASSLGMKIVAFENANGKRTVTCKRTTAQATASVTITGLAPSAVHGVRKINSGTVTLVDGADVTADANGWAVLTLAPGYTTVYAR